MSPEQKRRWIGLGIGSAVLAAVAVGVGSKWALGRYIESESFRLMVGRTTGASWHAEARFAPFHLAGSDLFCESIDSLGQENAAFATLEVRQIHARWSLRKLLDRVCQLDRVEVEQATIELDGPRQLPAAAVGHGEPGGTSFFSSLAPNRVEVGSASLQHGHLGWAGGHLRDTALEATAENQAGRPTSWQIEASGGVIDAQGWPALHLDSCRLRYREPTFFIQSAKFRQGAAGTLAVDGEVAPGREADLHATWEGMPLDAVLTPDWRQHVHGTLNGEARMHGPLPATSPLELTGSWSVSGGRLEALPMLDDLAAFTNTAQFRQVALSRLSGDFHRRGARLELTQIVAESTGLARVEGSLTLEGESLDGRLQLGLAPSLVQLLPGARASVFAVARDGYLWTDVRLAGPAAHPREDLSARLASAAAGQAIESAGQAAGQIRERAQDAAKGVLDLIFGK